MENVEEKPPREGEAGHGDDDDELEQLEKQLYGGDDGDDGADASEDVKDEDAGNVAPAQPMSKSQMKKLARLERMKAQRQAARQREKEAKAARRAEAQERKKAELASMSEEQKAALKAEQKAKLQAHRDAEKQLKDKLKEALNSGPRIVIDLAFEDKMVENDIRHLCKQLGFSYSANKTADKPAHMVLTSFTGTVASTAKKMISGFDNWFITRTPDHYLDYFKADNGDRGRLVYLTADSENELTELDDSKIYVIGGLVDHNKYKGLCERQARNAGIPTARLPINRHMQLATSAVLTVNHVYQILVEYYSRRDWADVLDFVLPQRKRVDYVKGQERPEGGGGSSNKGGAPGGGKAGAAGRSGGAAAAAAPAAAVESKAEEKGSGEAKADAEAKAEAGGEREGQQEAGQADGESEGRGTKRKAEGDAEA